MVRKLPKNRNILWEGLFYILSIVNILPEWVGVITAADQINWISIADSMHGPGIRRAF
jgi:hypothetical protein